MKFRFYYLSLLLLLWWPRQTFAQNNVVLTHIRGTVFTATEPAAFATVSLLTTKDSAAVTSTQSNADGKFELKAKPGEYLLTIKYIGFEQRVRRLKILPGVSELQLDRLELHATSKALSEVVVSASAPILQITNEKQVFDLSKSMVAKGGSAADALKQVLSLNVSPLGKLTLRDGSPVILVDGKRTLLKLEQIPADQIQSVEIMTNPSAKYDASGTSGIVNIILKKNKKTGVTGSISENFTTLPENTINGELNARNSKFNLSAYYNYHNHLNKGTGTTTRQDVTDGSQFNQQNDDKTKGTYHSARVVFDYFADKQNTFSFNANLSKGVFNTTNNQQTNYLHNALIDSSGLRQTKVESRFTSWRFSLDHTHNFKKDGEKLVTGINTQFYDGPDKGTYNEAFYNSAGATSRASFLQRYAYAIKAHTINIQSDYTLPFNKDNRLEAGVKVNLHKDDNRNTMEDFDQPANAYRLNNRASYHYGYDDNTYAGYTTLSGKKGKFSYLAGVRYELYDFRGEMRDSNQVFSYHNPGLYPSIFLTQKLTEGNELRLNYARRVNRPGFDEISPRIDFTNPLNLTQGNTNLLSEYSNNVEFSYSYHHKEIQVITTAYYRNTSNLITQYTAVFAGDTLISRYANAGHSNNYGAELTFKANVAAVADITANLNAAETRINAANLQNGLSNAGFTWFAKLNTEFKLPQEIGCQLTGNYHAGEVLPQGRNLAYGSVDLGFNRSFLKTKAVTFTASITDIFNTQKNRQRINLPGLLTQNVDYKPVSRVMQFNLTYRFGKSNG